MSSQPPTFESIFAEARQHDIPIRRIIIEHGAIRQIADVLAELSAPQPIGILCDANTHRAAGQAVEDILRQSGLDAACIVLPGDEHGWVEDDEPNLAVARRMTTHARTIIGCGSGVINDVGKLVAMHPDRPYISVATAASMNGYGSPISAHLKDGIKTTVTSAPTLAIIADLDVIAAAPVRMSRSGLGDLLAKNASAADWLLARRLVNDLFHEPAYRMIRAAGANVMQHATAIPSGDPTAIRLLAEGLIIGGFAMDVAGASSPASGGEHLISHYIDMVAYQEARRPALHGEQVALGTIIALTLYEHLRRIDPHSIDPDTLAQREPTLDQRLADLERVHGPLGKVLIDEVRAKWVPSDVLRDRIVCIRDQWDTIWQEIDEVLLPADTVRNAYRAAGTPTTAAELDIPPELITRALRLGRDVRARYTCLQFAWDLGVLDDLVPVVLDDSGVI